MSNASEWAATLKAFHEKQLDRPRRVYRLGRTKVIFSGGHAACTVGAAVAASAWDFPSWAFWIAIALGFVVGKFLFPVPRSSVASRYGSKELARKSPGDLDYMTPAEIRAYQYNVQFIQKGVTPLALGTEEALGRQSEAVRTVSLAAGADGGCWLTFPSRMSRSTGVLPTVTICLNADGANTRWTRNCSSIFPP